MHIASPGAGDLAAPATEPEPDTGLGALATSKGNLPLETLDIRAFITGTTASIELAQGFRNPFNVPLEATYWRPVPGMRLGLLTGLAVVGEGDLDGPFVGAAHDAELDGAAVAGRQGVEQVVRRAQR